MATESNRCMLCREGFWVHVDVEHTVRAVGHLFTFRDVPAERCDSCGEVRHHGVVLERVNLFVADEIARAGLASGDALRFMRKALGMKATELAELLEMVPETISRWETGKQEIDRRALAIVGAMVADKLQRRDTIVARLRALKQPRKVENTVVRWSEELRIA